jgi:hypothetical protein
MTAQKQPIRFPEAPNEYSQQWAASLVRTLNLMYDNITQFRTATGQWQYTASDIKATDRNADNVATASDARAVIGVLVKDLVDGGYLP